MGDRITIREIAEKAKVSAGTVDRVLHDRGEVSAKTREKVLRIAREGNYEPNIFARHLVLNKTFAIISMIPDPRQNHYWSFPLAGISQAVEEHKAFGIRNSVCFFGEGKDDDFYARATEALKANPDGILLAPVIYDKALWLAGECEKRGIPLVLIDSDLPAVKKLASISQDAAQSGLLAAKLLHYSHGNSDARRFYIATIIRKQENNDVIKQRKEGFYAYFKNHFGLDNQPQPNEADNRNNIDSLNIIDSRKNRSGLENHSVAPASLLPLGAEKTGISIEEVVFKVEEPEFSRQLAAFAGKLEKGDAVFSPNSKVHWLAAALDKLPEKKQPRLIGYDLTEKNIAYLQKGSIDFLINQKPELQGFRGVQALYKHLVLKQEVEKRVFMPLEIITKENLPFIS